MLISLVHGSIFLQASPQLEEQNRLTAERVIFRSSLSKVKCPDPSLTAFVCYDQEDEFARHQVVAFIEDLVASGIAKNNLYFDLRPGSSTTIFEYAHKIFETEKVLVIGSPGLKAKYEKKERGRGISSHQIENLLTRIINQKVAGIIPCWFRGTKEENIPSSLQCLQGRFLGDNYFLNFFDLLLDLYEGSPIDHPISKLQKEFADQCASLSSEFIALHAEKLQRYRKETEERFKADFEKFLTDQLLHEKPTPRPWRSITDEVLYSLPDRPHQFVESFPLELSQESYLTELWQKLHADHQVTLSQASITGLGGVGKTTLALAYAYEAFERKAYDFIYFLDSETDDKLLKGYQGILRKLEYPFQGVESLEDLVETTKQELSSKKKWLLIYDNVPEPSFLENKTPQLKGHTLITSRCNEGWEGWGYSPLYLDVFRKEDALEYFFKDLCYKRTKENEELASQIAEELGYLPLALSHAKAFIAFSRTTSLQGYLDKLKEQPQIIISSIAPFRRRDPNRISYEYFVSKGTREIWP